MIVTVTLTDEGLFRVHDGSEAVTAPNLEVNGANIGKVDDIHLDTSVDEYETKDDAINLIK